MPMIKRFRPELALLALLACGCVSEKPSAKTGMKPASGTTADEPSRSPVDARIAGLADATNSGLIELARVAWGRGQHQELRTFAHQQVMRHEDAVQEQSRVESELGLTPLVSEHSAALRARSQQQVARLLAVDHDDFDVEYLDTQLRWHEDALKLYDKELLPYAKNSKLSAQLSAQRELIASQREELRRLFDQLGPPPFGPNSVPAL
jgi:predicted outer membrane protein